MKKAIGKWEIQVGSPRSIGRDLIQEMERFLNRKWKQVILEEIDHPWWSVNQLGIPSPIVRIDMAPAIEPGAIKNFFYEVEVRPAGLGTMLSLVPERTEQWKKVLGQCQGFISQSSIQDDKLAAEILGIPYYEQIPSQLEGPYWVRSDLREGETVMRLENVSLVPIRQDGDKTYLVKLGLAERLQVPEQLDWYSPFVVKPLVGSKMKGVKIYLPKSLKLGPGGSTKSQILRTISELPCIIQKFIPPKEDEIFGRKGWTIWRLFFGWEVKYEKYEFIGGLWNWRPNLRVHGASDAVMGPIDKI